MRYFDFVGDETHTYVSSDMAIFICVVNSLLPYGNEVTIETN